MKIEPLPIEIYIFRFSWILSVVSVLFTIIMGVYMSQISKTLQVALFRIQEQDHQNVTLKNDKKVLKKRVEDLTNEIEIRVDNERKDENLRLQIHQKQEEMKKEEVEKEEKVKEVRIWMDGAFDLMHFGHMNAFRQGKALGTYLIVGVNTDESIQECKGGPPILSLTERVRHVKSCKWVDEVVDDVPYVMNAHYLHEIISKYSIDYIVHGDDACLTVDGIDVYEEAKKLNKYRTIPRTEGVSTTDIVGRMLLLTKTHHQRQHGEDEHNEEVVGVDTTGDGNDDMKKKDDNLLRMKPLSSKFCTTSNILRLFSQNVRRPRPDQKVVYLSGSFDLFNAAHTKILEMARHQCALEMCKDEEDVYLIVGVWTDSVVNVLKGSNYPIMNLQERVLSLLGSSYVDDVLIGAPYEVTKETIQFLNIDLVYYTPTSSTLYATSPSSPTTTSPITNNTWVTRYAEEEEEDCKDEVNDIGVPSYYTEAYHMGILRQVEIHCEYTASESILERIESRRDVLEPKIKSKTVKEAEYYNEKYSK